MFYWGRQFSAFAVLQKHFIRPVESQLVLYPLVGGLVFALLTPSRISSAAAVALGVAAGLFAATLSTTGHAERLRAMTIAGPARFAGSMAALTDGVTVSRWSIASVSLPRAS